MSKGSKTARDIYVNQSTYYPMKSSRNTSAHRASTYIQQLTNRRTSSRQDDNNPSKNQSLLDKSNQDSGYLAPKQKKKENIQPELKNREMKYLMRIAALEKENQKMNDQIDKYRRENSELLKYDSFKKQIEKLQYCIEQQKTENMILKKSMSNLSHTSSGLKNISTRANTLTSTSTITYSAQKTKIEYIPSYMAALNLVQ